MPSSIKKEQYRNVLRVLDGFPVYRTCICATAGRGIGDAPGKVLENTIQENVQLKNVPCMGTEEIKKERRFMCKSFEQAYESLQDSDCGFVRLNHEIDCMIKDTLRSCTGKLDDDSLDAMGDRLVDEAERTQYEAYDAGFKHAFRLAAWLLLPEQEGLLNERIQTLGETGGAACRAGKDTEYGNILPDGEKSTGGTLRGRIRGTDTEHL